MKTELTMLQQLKHSAEIFLILGNVDELVAEALVQ